MKITKEEVEHVARLARLELNEAEKELMLNQLDSILRYMEKLNELDTANIEPTSHVLPMTNVMRGDELRPCIGQEEALANAPDPFDIFFRVPRIIE